LFLFLLLFSLFLLLFFLLFLLKVLLIPLLILYGTLLIPLFIRRGVLLIPLLILRGMLLIPLLVLYGVFLIPSLILDGMLFIANGISSPIWMISFPFVKTLQAIRFSRPPDIPGPQINVSTVGDPNIFDAIPSIVLWDEFHRWCRCKNDWLVNNYRSDPFPAILINGATQQKVQGNY
jgi:hypothetical protein